MKRKEKVRKFKRNCRNFNVKVSKHNAMKAMELISVRSANQKTQWTYYKLKDEAVVNKGVLINWLMKRHLISSSRLCPHCNGEMRLVKCSDRSDGYKLECKRQVNGKRHKVILDTEGQLV